MAAMDTRGAVFLTLATGLLLAACGGHDPGSGSRTLFVHAQAETDGSTDGSWMMVKVRQGNSEGQPVTDATVTVTGDNGGEVGLPFELDGYTRRRISWDTGWGLEVKRGDDALQAYLEAPGITTITRPIGGTTFKRAAGDDLLVTWTDEKMRKADFVTVEFKRAGGADREFTGDPFEYEVELNRLVADDDERISVKRRNEVNLEGGTPGSRFSAVTRHRVDLKVE
jgi:hypothetical protein